MKVQKSPREQISGASCRIRVVVSSTKKEGEAENLTLFTCHCSHSQNAYGTNRFLDGNIPGSPDCSASQATMGITGNYELGCHNFLRTIASIIHLKTFLFWCVVSQQSAHIWNNTKFNKYKNQVRCTWILWAFYYFTTCWCIQLFSTHLFGQEHSMDIGKNASRGYRHTA